MNQLSTWLTLVIRDGQTEHVYYPVFPPDQQVMDWLRAQPPNQPG